MDYLNELYIDIEIKSENHRITLRHTDKPCDAEILLDGNKISTRLKTLVDGGAFFFQVDTSRVIITIRKLSDDSFSYDCFVDGKSVRNSMPWKEGSMTVPEMLRWQKQRRSGKAMYVISETIKGILLGCALFFILYFFENFTDYDYFHVTWLFLVFTVVPLGLLYFILSPIEYNKSEKRYALFNKYLTETADNQKRAAKTAPDSVSSDVKSEDYSSNVSDTTNTEE